MPGQLWISSDAPSANNRRFPGDRPICDAFSVAAELKGESAEGSNFVAHYLREAQSSRLDDDQSSWGGPTRRMEKLIEAAKGPADTREFMDFGWRHNIIRQSGLSFPCVGPEPKRRSGSSTSLRRSSRPSGGAHASRRGELFACMWHA